MVGEEQSVCQRGERARVIRARTSRRRHTHREREREAKKPWKNSEAEAERGLCVCASVVRVVKRVSKASFTQQSE